MGPFHTKVTYKGYRTAGGWEVVVERPGQPLRMLDLPRREGQWALSILTNYLADEDRAADLYREFNALTLYRFTEDWELSEHDIENTLTEVEALRLRWHAVLARC
jgi:hypothetical protein